MTADELYDREVALALKAANIEWKPDDRILDLASGVGEHARRMSKVTGAEVDARDIAPILVKEAVQRTQGDTHAKVHAALGDIAHIKKSVDPQSRYRLITCLGGSFCYLHNKEVLRAALRDYYDLLVPGGKLVLQSRDTETKKLPGKERTPEQKEAQLRAQKQLKVSKEEGVVAEGPQGKRGKFAKEGTPITIFRDHKKEGDGYYLYRADWKDAYVGADWMQQRDSFGFTSYKDSDGVEHLAFGRAYIDKAGEEMDLGLAHVSDYMMYESFGATKKLLEEAGFTNIQLVEDEKPLSPDGLRFSFAIAAEKP